MTGFNDLPFRFKVLIPVIVTGAILFAVGSINIARLAFMSGEAFDSARMLLWTTAIGGALLALLVLALLPGAVTQQFANLSAFMNDLAAGGSDITRRLPAADDGIGKVGVSFNRFMDGLHGSIVQLRDSADQVSTLAQQLSQSSNQVSQGSLQQADAAASTVAAVNQITSSIASVAQAAEEVRALSKKGLEHTRKGNASLTDLEKELGHVHTAVNAIASSVGEFVKNTHAITAMTKQVKDLAEQTNLLALNAAIEAARAGEQGRGFAVVADEVRKLAEKSAQAASQIDEVTRNLEEQSGQVEQTIQQGQSALQSSASHMHGVASVLSDANDAVSKATAAVDDITDSVKEQTSVNNDITRNVDRIAKMVDESRAAVQQAAQGAGSLSQIAANLRQATSRFKLNRV